MCYFDKTLEGLKTVNSQFDQARLRTTAARVAGEQRFEQVESLKKEKKNTNPVKQSKGSHQGAHSQSDNTSTYVCVCVCVCVCVHARLCVCVFYY